VEQKPSDQTVAHYFAMAHATYDLAEQCEDLEMLAAYLQLAAKWLGMAQRALSDAQGGPQA
jgi:hypothetical protein